jgi:hypothetical protein
MSIEQKSIIRIYNILYANPHLSPEEALLKVSEEGEVFEDPTIIEILSKYIGKATNNAHERFLQTITGMCVKIQNNIDSVYNSCVIPTMKSVKSTFVPAIKSKLDLITDVITEEYKQYINQYTEDCKKKMIESSDLFKEITRYNNALSNMDKNIELLNKLIINTESDGTLDLNKILPSDASDTTSIYHFAFENIETKDVVQSHIYSIYVSYKSLYGTSHGQPTHTFQDKLSEIDIIKNIISIYYTDTEDFNELQKDLKFTFENVYIPYDCIQIINLPDKKIRRLIDIEPDHLKAYFDLCDYLKRHENISRTHNKKQQDPSFLVRDNDDESGALKRIRPSIVRGDYTNYDDTGFDQLIPNSIWKPRDNIDISYTPEELENLKVSYPTKYYSLLKPLQSDHGQSDHDRLKVHDENKFASSWFPVFPGGKSNKTKKLKNTKKTKKVRKNKQSKNKQSKKQHTKKQQKH